MSAGVSPAKGLIIGLVLGCLVGASLTLSVLTSTGVGTQSSPYGVGNHDCLSLTLFVVNGTIYAACTTSLDWNASSGVPLTWFDTAANHFLGVQFSVSGNFQVSCPVDTHALCVLLNTTGEEATGAIYSIMSHPSTVGHIQLSPDQEFGVVWYGGYTLELLVRLEWTSPWLIV
jgi:hypothetical protein